MRITAGFLRGRGLRAPRGQGTRPTPERVREAVFSTLGSVADASVLDAYAGSGALGLEALSRGARRAVFVECARTALAALRANVVELGLETEAEIIAGALPAIAAAVAARGPFDLVFADPPYAAVESGEAVRALERLVAQAGTLAPEFCLVLEHAWRTPAPALATVGLRETRRYGDTAVSYYGPHAATRGAEPAPSPDEEPR